MNVAHSPTLFRALLKWLLPQNGLPEPPRKISALPYPLQPPLSYKGGPLQDFFPLACVLALSSASRIYGLSRPLERELRVGAATESGDSLARKCAASMENERTRNPPPAQLQGPPKLTSASAGWECRVSVGRREHLLSLTLQRKHSFIKKVGCEVLGSKAPAPSEASFWGLNRGISLWQLFRNQPTVQREVRPKPAPPADLAQRASPGTPAATGC